MVQRVKIIGFAYIDGRTEIVLKGDSSLLNGRKPMFVPCWTHDLRVTPCIVLRVSRLGKNIAVRFGNRYYDAIAPGADFMAYDVLSEARMAGDSWTRALAFDFSLAVGEFGTDGNYDGSIERADGTVVALPPMPLVVSPDEAIHRASEIMTIRQGDLVYIQYQTNGQAVFTNDILRACQTQEEKLYCKIK